MKVEPVPPGCSCGLSRGLASVEIWQCFTSVISAKTPLCLACLSQMESKREWMTHSWSIKTQWTCTVAKRKQTLSAWKTLPVLKSSRIVRTASLGDCVPHLVARGRGEVVGLRTGFGVVHVPSVPSPCCMEEGREDSGVVILSSPSCPKPTSSMTGCFAAPDPAASLGGRSPQSCCAEQGRTSPPAPWIEGAAMQGLSPAHSSCFHTAALLLEMLCCVRTMKPWIQIQKCTLNQKLKASMFLTWG